MAKTKDILDALPPMKYKRPDDLPGRVCRVLEGHLLLAKKEGHLLLAMESKDPLASMVYRFAHIASGRCGNPHEDWMAEFVKLEAEIEEAAYTSPAKRKRMNDMKTVVEAVQTCLLVMKIRCRLERDKDTLDDARNLLADLTDRIKELTENQS